MMNEKGSLVLRDMVFMMMIVSAIFVLSGLYVSEMASNYENTNMSDEWGITGTNSLANSTFYSVGENASETGKEMAEEPTGIFSLIDSGASLLKGIGKALFMVMYAPNTIGDLVGATLEDVGAGSVEDKLSISWIIKYLIIAILWGIVIFTISSAVLKGGKL